VTVSAFGLSPQLDGAPLGEQLNRLLGLPLVGQGRLGCDHAEPYPVPAVVPGVLRQDEQRQSQDALGLGVGDNPLGDEPAHERTPSDPLVIAEPSGNMSRRLPPLRRRSSEIVPPFWRISSSIQGSSAQRELPFSVERMKASPARALSTLCGLEMPAARIAATSDRLDRDPSG
jgi:hypothetical protein